MAKQQAFSSRIDAKEFFEASVRALRDEGKSAEKNRRNRALVQRAETGEAANKRAIADAAKALTALWKMQPSTRSV